MERLEKTNCHIQPQSCVKRLKRIHMGDAPVHDDEQQQQEPSLSRINQHVMLPIPPRTPMQCFGYVFVWKRAHVLYIC